MLKPEIKTAWLEALRSGRYAQTTEWLCNTATRQYDDGGSPIGEPYKAYCCLGVLQNLYPNNLPKRIGDELLDYWATEEFAGLTVADQNILAPMNDGGKNFAEIADYIEANL